MLHRNIERKKNSEGNNITCRWKLKKMRARSQEKKGEKKKLIKMYNLCLLLLLWLLSSTEKNNLIDLLQHPVVSMFIPICLPIHNSKNIVSIAFLSQRHHIIIIYTYLIDCWQFRLHPVVFIINHPSVVVVTLYLLPTHHIKIV